MLTWSQATIDLKSFYLIGGEGGANFLDQSQRVVKKTMLKISLLKTAEKKRRWRFSRSELGLRSSVLSYVTYSFFVTHLSASRVF